MGLTEDIKNRTHDAVKQKETRQKIEAIARDEGVSFNEAIKRFYAQK